MCELKITLSLDEDEALKAWKQAVQKIINLTMQVYALPPHVLKENKIPYKPDYLAEYLQQQRVQMYKEDISKGLIKEVW